MLKKSNSSKVKFFSFSNIRFLVFFSVSFVFLLLVGYVTVVDLVYWQKDLGFIFFGPRLGEPITLGVGMTLFYYLLIGLVLLGVGFVLFIRDRSYAAAGGLVDRDIDHKLGKELGKVVLKKKTSGAKEKKNQFRGSFPFPRKENVDNECSHRFGYLSNRPKGSPVPSECICCSRLGGCMVATVFVKKMEDD